MARPILDDADGLLGDELDLGVVQTVEDSLDHIGLIFLVPDLAESFRVVVEFLSDCGVG